MPELWIPTDPEWAWAYEAILYTSGEEFPEAREAEMRGLAQDLVEFSRQLNGASFGVNTFAHGVFASLEGDASRAFRNFVTDVAKEVPEGAQVAVDMADQVQDFALDTEQTKYTVTIAMFQQVIDIFLALSAGFAFLVPFHIGVGGRIVRALISGLKSRTHQRIANIVVQGVDEGLEEMWQSGLGQAIQFAEGNRKKVDSQGLMIDFFAGMFVGWVGSVLHLSGKKWAPKATDTGVGHGVIDGLSELPVEAVLSSIMGASFNPGATFVAGLVGGASQKWAETIGGGQNPGTVDGSQPELKKGLGPNGENLPASAPGANPPTRTSPPGVTPAGSPPASTVPPGPNPNGPTVRSGTDPSNPNGSSIGSGSGPFNPNGSSVGSGIDPFNPNGLAAEAGADPFNPNGLAAEAGADPFNPNGSSVGSGIDPFNPNSLAAEAGADPSNPNGSSVGSGADPSNSNGLVAEAGADPLNPVELGAAPFGTNGNDLATAANGNGTTNSAANRDAVANGPNSNGATANSTDALGMPGNHSAMPTVSTTQGPNLTAGSPAASSVASATPQNATTGTPTSTTNAGITPASADRTTKATDQLPTSASIIGLTEIDSPDSTSVVSPPTMTVAVDDPTISAPPVAPTVPVATAPIASAATTPATSAATTPATTAVQTASPKPAAFTGVNNPAARSPKAAASGDSSASAAPPPATGASANVEVGSPIGVAPTAVATTATDTAQHETRSADGGPRSVTPAGNDTARPVRARPVPSGISLVPATDRPSQSHAEAFAPHDAHYHVFAHGTEDAIEADGQRIDPHQLATLIREDSTWDGRSVVLVACDTGVNPNSGFATQLAHALPGTTVIAPNGTTWTTPDGRAIVAPASFDDQGRPRVASTPGDQWQAISTSADTGTGPGVRIASLGPELPLTPPGPAARTPYQQPVSWSAGDRADGTPSTTATVTTSAQPAPPTTSSHATDPPTSSNAAPADSAVASISEERRQTLADAERVLREWPGGGRKILRSAKLRAIDAAVAAYQNSNGVGEWRRALVRIDQAIAEWKGSKVSRSTQQPNVLRLQSAVEIMRGSTTDATAVAEADSAPAWPTPSRGRNRLRRRARVWEHRSRVPGKPRSRYLRAIDGALAKYQAARTADEGREALTRVELAIGKWQDVKQGKSSRWDAVNKLLDAVSAGLDGPAADTASEPDFQTPVARTDREQASLVLRHWRTISQRPGVSRSWNLRAIDATIARYQKAESAEEQRRVLAQLKRAITAWQTAKPGSDRRSSVVNILMDAVNVLQSPPSDMGTPHTPTPPPTDMASTPTADPAAAGSTGEPDVAVTTVMATPPASTMEAGHALVLTAISTDMAMAQDEGHRYPARPGLSSLTDLVSYANDPARRDRPADRVGFARTTIKGVRHAMAASGTGSRGFAVVGGQPGTVLSVIRTDAETVFVNGETGLEVRVDDETPMWFLPTTGGIVSVAGGGRAWRSGARPVDAERVLMRWPTRLSERPWDGIEADEYLHAYQHAATLQQRQDALAGLGAAISAWQMNQLTTGTGWIVAQSRLRDQFSDLQQAVALLLPAFASADITASGLTLLDSTDPERSGADQYPSHPDRYMVFAHGGPGGTVWANGRSVSPQEMASIIRADSRSEDRVVVLAAADTGADPDDGYAAQLARLLPNVRIVAPAGGIQTTPDGDLTVSGPTPTWRVFRSRIAPSQAYTYSQDPSLIPGTGRVKIEDFGPTLLAPNPFEVAEYVAAQDESAPESAPQPSADIADDVPAVPESEPSLTTQTPAPAAPEIALTLQRAATALMQEVDGLPDPFADPPDPADISPEQIEDAAADAVRSAADVHESARHAQELITQATQSLDAYLHDARAALARADIAQADIARQLSAHHLRLARAERAGGRATDSHHQISDLAELIDPGSESELARALSYDLEQQAAAEAELAAQAFQASADVDMAAIAERARHIREQISTAVDDIQRARTYITILANNIALQISLADTAGAAARWATVVPSGSGIDQLGAAHQALATVASGTERVRLEVQSTLDQTAQTVTGAHQAALETTERLRLLKQHAERMDAAAREVSQHTETTHHAAVRAAQLVTRVQTALQPVSTITARAFVHHVPSGMSLLPASDLANHSHAEAVGEYDDRYHVFAHGNEGALEVDGLRIDADQLAMLIKEDPAWRDRPIVLIACDTGADLTDGFATKLARELPGATVIAPSGTTWTTPDGRAIVAPTAYDAHGRPHLTPAHHDEWRAITITTDTGAVGGTEANVEITALGAELPLILSGPAAVQRAVSWNPLVGQRPVPFPSMSTETTQGPLAARLAEAEERQADLAARLARDLRASVHPNARAGLDQRRTGPSPQDRGTDWPKLEHVLGPDFFAVRTPRPAPSFLNGVHIGSITPAQQAAFFDRMSLTRPAAPTSADLTPSTLPSTGAVSRAERPPHRRTWGPEENQLPPVVEIPHIAHSIWMGGPLRDAGKMKAFRDNIANNMRGINRGTFDHVVWTDIPRDLADRARNEPDNPELHDVRDMLTWAQTNGVRLVNIDEVFHEANALELHSLFKTAWARRTPAGYTEASDILRVELMYLFGGVYTDGDNIFTRGLAAEMDRVAASDDAYAMDRGNHDKTFNNAAMMAPPGHPALWHYLRIMETNYAMTQPELYAAHGLDRSDRGGFVNSPDAWDALGRRNSLLLRTGPEGPVTQLARYIGLADASDLPKLRAGVASSHGARTWVEPRLAGASAPSGEYHDVLEATRFVVATLVRGVRKREGDLHLTSVAPVVNAQRDPGAVWIAALELVRDLVGGEVTSVTDVRLENSGVETAVVLPPAAQALLDVGGAFPDGRAQRWPLDERQRPARMRTGAALPRTPLIDLAEMPDPDSEAGDRVWLRTPEQAADSAMRAAAARMVVPPGHVGVWLESRHGQAWVGDRPVSPDELAALLDDLGLADKLVVLVLSEGASSPVDYARQLAEALDQPVQATTSLAWIHPATGAVLASDRRGATGAPVLPPDGDWVEFRPGGGDPTSVEPIFDGHALGESPAADWVSRSDPHGRTQLPRPQDVGQGYGSSAPQDSGRRLPTSMGARGRIEKLGDVRFDRPERIADMVVGAVPPDVPEPLRKEIRQGLLARLFDLGPRPASARLLSDGLRFLIYGGRQEVIVRMEFDRTDVTQLKRQDVERDLAVPVGEQEGTARDESAQGLGVGRPAGSNSVLGEDMSVGTQRGIDYGGESVYFDVSSRLTVDVEPVGEGGRRLAPADVAARGGVWRGPAVTHRTLLGFPKEVATTLSDGADPGAPDWPTLGPRLGLPPSAAPAPAAAVRRLSRVLGAVAHAPQSLRGNDVLHQRILALFPDAGFDFRERLTTDLSENSLLKLFGFLPGGLPSPSVPLGGAYGHEQAGYVLTAGLRSIERVLHPEPVPLRFAAGASTTIIESGSSPTGRSDVDSSGQERRGLSDSEPTVLYRAEVAWNAQLLSGLAAGETVTADGEVYLRVPEREAARFEAMVAHAAAAPDTVARPAEPAVPAGEERAVPDAIATQRGLGPSTVDILEGSDEIADAAVNAIRAAEQGLAPRQQGWRWTRPWRGLRRAAPPPAPAWTPAQESHLRAALAAQLSTPAMLARAGRLLTTRGLAVTYERTTPAGVETVTVTVRVRRLGPVVQARADGVGVDLRPAAGSGRSETEELRRDGAHSLVDTGSSHSRGAIFPPGPVRTFTYPVAYDIEARVEIDGHEGMQQSAVDAGRVRYVVPESMTADRNAAPLQAGPSDATPRPLGRRRAWRRPWRRGGPQAMPLLPLRGTFGPNDLLTDLRGEAELAAEVARLVDQFGLAGADIDAQVDAGTARERLMAHLLRDPHGAASFLVGRPGGPRARVWLQPTVGVDRPTGLEPSPAAWSRTEGETGSSARRIALPGPTSAANPNPAMATSSSAGREITDPPRPHSERVAALRWRVTVVDDPPATTLLPGPAPVSSDLEVPNALSFLRPLPVAGARRAHVPDTLSADGRPGARVLPAGAVSERLEFRPGPAHGAANPLMTDIAALLRGNGLGDLLARDWHAAGDGRRAALPTTLSALLTDGALSGMDAQLRSGGVVLEPRPKANWLGWVRRPKIVLMGHRRGDYGYIESLDDASVATLTARGRGGADVVRDTQRVDGPAHRFGSDDYEITAVLVPASRPGRILDRLLLGLPARLNARARGLTDPARAVREAPARLRRTVRLREQLILPDRTLTGPDRAAPAISALASNAELGRLARENGITPLPLTADDFLDGQAEVAFRPEAVRALVEHALPGLSGENGDAMVARSLWLDGGGLDHLLRALAPQRLGRGAAAATPPSADGAPPLVREGGLLTDTIGAISVSYQLYGRPLDWRLNSTVDSEAFRVEDTRSTPLAEAPRRLPFLSRRRAGDATTTRRLVHGAARHRETPLLDVDAGVLVRVTIDAERQRGGAPLPNWVPARYRTGRTTLTFRIDHAGQLLLSPEKAVELGIERPDGIPVPSGRFFPEDGPSFGERGRDETTTEERALRYRDAAAVPRLTRDGGDDPLVLTVPGLRAGTVRHGGRDYTAREFAVLVRSLPEFHGQDVVLIAPRAGRRTLLGDDGRSVSFAELFLAELGVGGVATPDDVWQDGAGEVVAGRLRLTADGAASADGRQAGNWLAFDPPGTGDRTPPRVLGANLVRAMGDDVPSDRRARPAPLAPGVQPPSRARAYAARVRGRFAGSHHVRTAFYPTPTPPPAPPAADRDTWYAVVGVESLGDGRYQISAAGRLRLRDATIVEPGGWRWFGGELVHPGASLTLSPRTGALTRASAETVAGWPQDGPGMTVTADILGLAAAPPGQPEEADVIPLRIRPADGVRRTEDAWTRPLSNAEQRMVYAARRNAAPRAAVVEGAGEAAAVAAAAKAAEWRLRHESAVDALMDESPRALPPGFGDHDPVTNRQRFALGHHGRLLWAGNRSLTTADAIAEAVVEALPERRRTLLADAVRAEVKARLRRYDPRLFVQAMMEGGTPLTVRVGGRQYTIRARLDLGNLDLARHVPLADAERTHPGHEWHVLVNADHEVQSFARTSVSNSRRFALSFAPLERDLADHHFQVSGGVGIAGTSGASYGQGFDWVSAMKRYLDVSGVPAFFDFGDAAVRTEVTEQPLPPPPTPRWRARVAALGRLLQRPAQTPPPPPPPAVEEGSARRTIRAEFPREFAPARPDGEAALTPATALPGERTRGLTDQQHRDGMADPDRRARTNAQAGALARVLGYVFTIPESAPGLDTLRDQVRTILNEGSSPLTDEAAQELDWWISEPAFLRMYGDITGPGALSPLIASGEHGAHVQLQAALLSAEAVSIDPVPMKEEIQRFTSDHNDFTESGGVGPDGRLKLQGGFGDVAPAAKGAPAKTSTTGTLALELSGSAFHSGERTLRTNSGAGDIRALVYDNDSVRYRLRMRATATIASDLPDVENNSTVDDVIEVYIRVPVQHKARFEELLDLAMNDPDRHPVDHWADRWAGRSVDPDPAPADAAEAAEQAAAEAERRYPPPPLAGGQSMASTAMERLAGAEDILPRTLEMIREAEAGLLGAKRRSAMEEAVLKRRLGSKLTREALMNAGTQLFQPGGMPFIEELSVGGVKQYMTIRVRAVRAAEPVSSSRVAKSKIELMPAGFAAVSGEDKLSNGLSLGAKLAAAVNVRSIGSTFGASANAGHSRSRDDSLTTGATGFQVQAMLYNGPSRTFDYEVRYEIDVEIHHRHTSFGLLKVLPKALWASVRRWPDRHLGHSAAVRRTLRGSTRFVIPEPMTPMVKPLDAEVRGTGARASLTHAAAVDDLTRAVGGHAPMNGDDVLTDVLGAEVLQNEIDQMLDETRAGGWQTPLRWLARVWAGPRVGRLAGRRLSLWATDVTQMHGMQIRGPSTYQPTLAVRGTVADTHVDVLMESFPVNRRSRGLPFTFRKMDVAEGGPIVAAGKTSSSANAVGGGASFGKTIGDHSAEGSGQHDVKWTKRTGVGTGMVPQTGRLTQISQPYQENVADVIWRITVMPRRKNLFGVFHRRRMVRYVRVSDGLRFFRPANPPATAAAVLGASPANAPAPRDIGPFPGRLPKLPVTAATERLLVAPGGPPAGAPDPGARRARLWPSPFRRGEAPRAGSGAPATTRPLNATGEPNVLLDVVTRLVQQGGGRYRNRRWTIEGRRDIPPKRLTTILNDGSGVALLDLLVGPGIVLVSTRSWPLWHRRLRIVLRAERDPGNNGYRLGEVVDDVNVSRYSFRLNTTTKSQSATTAKETGLAGAGTVGALGSVLTKFATALNLKSIRSKTQGTSLTVTDAARDTLFIPGSAGRYYGNLRIHGELVKVAQPSRVLNLFTLDGARRLMRRPPLPIRPANAPLPSRWQRWGHNRRYTTSQDMVERVLVPRDLVRPDAVQRNDNALERNNNPALPRVVELPPGTPAAKLGPQLAVSADDILSRQVFDLGFDAETVRRLQDLALARLGGEQRSLFGDPGRTVRRLTDVGSRSRDAMHNLMTGPMFTRELELLVSEEGLVSPNLVADGGPLTDTHGVTAMRVELLNPRVLNFINGWHEWASYGFTEHRQEWGASDAENQELKLTPGLANLGISAAIGLTQTAARGGLAVMKSEWPTTGNLRTVPWLRVAGDAVVHITVNAHNRRGLLRYPGDSITLSFLLRDALELAFAPEASLGRGLLHPHGMPVPSGRYIPSHAVSTDRSDSPDAALRRAEQLHAVFGFPAVPDAAVIHVTTRTAPDGSTLFEVNDQLLSAADFHGRVLRHLELDGKTVVLVGSHVDAPGRDGSASAAAELAALTGRPVVSTAATAHTTSDGHVLAATPATTAGQHYLAETGVWTLTPPPGPGSRVRQFTMDLVDSLKQASLSVLQPAKQTLPPLGPVVWGSDRPAPGARGSDSPTSPPGLSGPVDLGEGLTAVPVRDGTVVVHPTGTPPSAAELDRAAALPPTHHVTTVLATSAVDPVAMLAAADRLATLLPASHRIRPDGPTLTRPGADGGPTLAQRLADRLGVALVAPMPDVLVPDVLSPEENERIFREEIVPNLLEGKPEREAPVLVIIGGQTGAGKTAVTQAAKDRLDRRGQQSDEYANINMDFYNAYHPRFAQLLTDDPQGASGRLRPDGDRWWDRATDYAIRHRNDVVLESAMLTDAEFEQLAARYRNAGYRVEATLLAVPESVSALGILSRYWNSVGVGGFGRVVTREDHDATTAGVLRGAEALDRVDIADEVVVYRRDGHVVYRNERGSDGRWQSPAGAAAAVRNERTRLRTPEEYRFITDELNRLRAEIGPEWHAEIDRIRALAAPIAPPTSTEDTRGDAEGGGGAAAATSPWLTGARLAAHTGLTQRVRDGQRDARVEHRRRQNRAHADYLRRREALKPHDVGGGGDCFYLVLLDQFAHEIGQHIQAPDPRRRMVDIVREHLAGVLQNDLDNYLNGQQAALHPITTMLRDQFGVNVDDEEVRAQYLHTIRTPGQYNNEAGDFMVHLAAFAFGFAATVLGPDVPAFVGVPGAPPTAYLWYNGGHYQVFRGHVGPVELPDMLLDRPALGEAPNNLIDEVRNFVHVDGLLGAELFAAIGTAADADAVQALGRAAEDLNGALDSLTREPTHDWLATVLRHYRTLAELVPSRLEPPRQHPHRSTTGDDDYGDHQSAMAEAAALARERRLRELTEAIVRPYEPSPPGDLDAMSQLRGLVREALERDDVSTAREFARAFARERDWAMPDDEEGS